MVSLINDIFLDLCFIVLHFYAGQDEEKYKENNPEQLIQRMMQPCITVIKELDDFVFFRRS